MSASRPPDPEVRDRRGGTAGRRDGRGRSCSPATTSLLRARAEPRAADAHRHEHLGARARSRLGRRPRAAARLAPRAAVRGDRGARRPRRRGAHARPPRPRRGGGGAARAHPAPLAAGRGEVDVRARRRRALRPVRGRRHARATPPTTSRSSAAGACFTGDAVLGSGQRVHQPPPGRDVRLPARARRACGCARTSTCCAPATGRRCGTRTRKLEEYVAHRLDRENRLIAALGEGRRTVDELLDAVWSDVPEPLRPAADGDARRAPGQARGRADPAAGRRAAALRAGRMVSAGAASRRPAQPERRTPAGGAAGSRATRAGLAVPADRRLRLPLGLPHRRARRLRRLDRVDVPAALRLAVGVRGDARPRRRQLARRPLRRLRAGRPALHPGHEHDRDDLDDAAGLAAGGRRADDRRLARQQARLQPHAPADRLRRRPPARAHDRVHPGPGAGGDRVRADARLRRHAGRLVGRADRARRASARWTPPTTRPPSACSATSAWASRATARTAATR